MALRRLTFDVDAYPKIGAIDIPVAIQVTINPRILQVLLAAAMALVLVIWPIRAGRKPPGLTVTMTLFSNDSGQMRRPLGSFSEVKLSGLHPAIDARTDLGYDSLTILTYVTRRTKLESAHCAS
jgi:hypothetical protein